MDVDVDVDVAVDVDVDGDGHGDGDGHAEEAPVTPDATDNTYFYQGFISGIISVCFRTL